MIGPAVADWPPDTLAWCQRCDRPIRVHRDPYCPMVPFVGSWGGFMHQFCPPVLSLVRSAPRHQETP